MSSGLGAFLVSLAGPIVRKAAISLGIGLVSYAAVSVALNSALGAAKAAFSGLTGDALSLLQLSGAPDVLSIIAGALIARVALMQVKRLEVLR